VEVLAVCKARVFPDNVPRKERRGPGLLLNHFLGLCLVRHVIVNIRHEHAETQFGQNGWNRRRLPVHTVSLSHDPHTL
jgi:hypothetical protein